MGIIYKLYYIFYIIYKLFKQLQNGWSNVKPFIAWNLFSEKKEILKPVLSCIQTLL